MKWIEEIKQINWKHTRWSELWRRNTFDRWQHNTTTTTTFGRTTEKKYRRKICCRFVGPPQHRVSVRFFFFSFGFFRSSIHSYAPVCACECGGLFDFESWVIQTSKEEALRMCAAQSNPTQSFGPYTWGFATDNTRADSVLEISPNINYTVSSESVSSQRKKKRILKLHWIIFHILSLLSSSSRAPSPHPSSVVVWDSLLSVCTRTESKSNRNLLAQQYKTKM